MVPHHCVIAQVEQETEFGFGCWPKQARDWSDQEKWKDIQQL